MQRKGQLKFKNQKEKKDMKEKKEERKKYGDYDREEQGQEERNNCLMDPKQLKEGEIGDQLVKKLKTGKTAAEIQYELVRVKRMGERIQQKMDSSYREKIESFNKNIAKMPEHFDIPKVGPG